LPGRFAYLQILLNLFLTPTTNSDSGIAYKRENFILEIFFTSPYK